MNRRQFLQVCSLSSLSAAANARSAGFFRVEERAGKWFLLDPEGRPFYMRGANHYGDGTYMPLNLAERFGDKAAWRRALRDRQRELGFNYLPPSIGPSETGTESKPPVRTETGDRRWQVDVRRTPEWPAAHFSELDFPFTAFLEYPRQYMAGRDLPDVFSRDFREAVDRRCREFCEPLRDNPNLIGYHFAHNPPWHSTNQSFHYWIADTLNRDGAGKREWAGLMRRIYGSVERYRRVYGAPIGSFDEIVDLPFPLRAYVHEAKGSRDQIAFMERICDEWYKVYSETVRKYDPNHLILGDRNTIHLHPLPDYAIHIMGRYIDVLSVNVMGPADVVYEVLEQATLHWDGPIHLADTGGGIYNGEWLKAGYQARDIAEYEDLYSSHMRIGVEHPQVIGMGWCGYYETPSSRSGLVDSRNEELLEDRAAMVKKWNLWQEKAHRRAFESRR